MALDSSRWIVNDQGRWTNSRALHKVWHAHSMHMLSRPRAVLCCAVPCCTMLCHAVPCCALLCYAMPHKDVGILNGAPYLNTELFDRLRSEGWGPIGIASGSRMRTSSC